MFTRFKLNTRGAVLIFTALLLPVAITFVGLVLDYGILYFSRTRLQDVADAAALAGATEMAKEKQNEDLDLDDEHKSAVAKTIIAFLKINDADFNIISADNEENFIVKHRVPEYDYDHDDEGIGASIDNCIDNIWLKSPDDLLGDKNMLIEYCLSGAILTGGEALPPDNAVITRRKTFANADRVRVRITKRVPMVFLGGFLSKYENGVPLTVVSAVGGSTVSSIVVNANKESESPISVVGVANYDSKVWEGVTSPDAYVYKYYISNYADLGKFMPVTEGGNEVIFYANSYNFNYGGYHGGRNINSISDLSVKDVSFTAEQIAKFKEKYPSLKETDLKNLSSASIYSYKFDPDLSFIFEEGFKKMLSNKGMLTQYGPYLVKASEIVGSTPEARDGITEIWNWKSPGELTYLGKICNISKLSAVNSSDSDYNYYKDDIAVINKQQAYFDKVQDVMDKFSSYRTDDSIRHVTVKNSGGVKVETDIQAGDKKIDVYLDDQVGHSVIDNSFFKGVKEINNLYINSSFPITLKTDGMIFNNIYRNGSTDANNVIKLEGTNNIYKGVIYAQNITVSGANPTFLSSFGFLCNDRLTLDSSNTSDWSMGKNSVVVEGVTTSANKVIVE